MKKVVCPYCFGMVESWCADCEIGWWTDNIWTFVRRKANNPEWEIIPKGLLLVAERKEEML